MEPFTVIDLKKSILNPPLTTLSPAYSSRSYTLFHSHKSNRFAVDLFPYFFESLSLTVHWCCPPFLVHLQYNTFFSRLQLASCKNITIFFCKYRRNYSFATKSSLQTRFDMIYYIYGRAKYEHSEKGSHGIGEILFVLPIGRGLGALNRSDRCLLVHDQIIYVRLATQCVNVFLLELVLRDQHDLGFGVCQKSLA